MPRLRFSIRTLMVATLVVAVVMFLIPDLAKWRIETQIRNGDYSGLALSHQIEQTAIEFEIVPSKTTMSDYFTLHRAVFVKIALKRKMPMKWSDDSDYQRLCPFDKKIDIRFCWITGAIESNQFLPNLIRKVWEN